MIGLVAALWCLYVSECFVRWKPGDWVLRETLSGRIRAVAEPDVCLLGGRLGFVWTSVLPWRRAWCVSGADVDVPAARTRFSELASHRRWLAVASTALFFSVPAGVTVLVLTGRLLPLLLPWLVAAATAWLATFVLFLRSHRRAVGHAPDFETCLALALSPLALIRAAGVVSLRAARRTHPVAAAAVLCDDEEFLRVARLWHYDEARLREEVERIANQRGLLHALTAPPPAEPGLTCFCPRCSETYAPGATHCADCHGVELLPLAAGMV